MPGVLYSRPETQKRVEIYLANEDQIDKMRTNFANEDPNFLQVLEEMRTAEKPGLVYAEFKRDHCVEMEKKPERMFEKDVESREANDELRRTVNQLRSKCEALETEKKAHCDKADAKVRELEAHVQRQFEDIQELEKLVDRQRTEAQKGISATAFDRMKTRVKDLLAEKERLQQEKQETEDECESLRWKLDDRGKLLNAAMEGLQAWKSTEGGLLAEFHRLMERSGRFISAAS